VTQKKDVRWYDNKDPSKRSIFEILFYNLIAVPIIRRKYRSLERKGRILIENIDNLKTALKRGSRGLAVVLVSNHLAEEDTTLLPYLVDKIDRTFCYKIAKIELFENFLERLKMYWVGARPIDRDAGTRDLWIVKRLIKNRKVILTFATGHRDPENKTPIEPGISIAIKKYKEDTVIVPIKLVCTDTLKNGGYPSVIFKEPILLENIPDSQRGTRELMQQIADAIGVPMPESKKRKNQNQSNNGGE